MMTSTDKVSQQKPTQLQLFFFKSLCNVVNAIIDAYNKNPKPKKGVTYVDSPAEVLKRVKNDSNYLIALETLQKLYSMDAVKNQDKLNNVFLDFIGGGNTQNLRSFLSSLENINYNFIKNIVDKNDFFKEKCSVWCETKWNTPLDIPQDFFEKFCNVFNSVLDIYKREVDNFIYRNSQKKKKNEKSIDYKVSINEEIKDDEKLSTNYEYISHYYNKHKTDFSSSLKSVINNTSICDYYSRFFLKKCFIDGKKNGLFELDFNFARLCYVFSSNILYFCDEVNVFESEYDYINVINTLYYDVFCVSSPDAATLSIEMSSSADTTSSSKSPKVSQLSSPKSSSNILLDNFKKNDFNTYTINIIDDINQDEQDTTNNIKKKQIILTPHFIGVFVMLMTEINHDFNRNIVPLNDIKELVREYLLDYVSQVFKNDTTSKYFDTIKNIIENLLSYLAEDFCQDIILKIYELKKIVCVQETQDGNYIISSKPESINSSFPRLFSEYKTIFLSADAKNALANNINTISSLIQVNKNDYPFVNFDAGNAVILNEQVQEGERKQELFQLAKEPVEKKTQKSEGKEDDDDIDDDIDDDDDKMDTASTRMLPLYNIRINDLYGDYMFDIHMTKNDNEYTFKLFFDKNEFNSSIDLLSEKLNGLNSFDNVSITNVAYLFNEANRIIDTYKSQLISDDNSIKKLLNRILISIISLKSVGDLLTYYVNLIDIVDENSTNNQDFFKKYAGLVTSADFSLMELPLVKILKNGTDYKPPCSLFAMVHIKNTEYVVPLCEIERKKIIFWDYISKLPNKWDSKNNNYNLAFNCLKLSINDFCDVYHGNDTPKNLKDISTHYNLLSHFLGRDVTLNVAPTNLNEQQQPNTKTEETLNNLLAIKEGIVAKEQRIDKNEYEYTLSLLDSAICDLNTFIEFKHNCKELTDMFYTEIFESRFIPKYTCFDLCKCDYFLLGTNCGEYFYSNDFMIKYDSNGIYYKGKKQIGVVFNLDKHTQSGSHWVAMHCNLDNPGLGEICYWDSYGIKPNPEVVVLINSCVVNFLSKVSRLIQLLGILNASSAVISPAFHLS